jgi:hypothetical protein
MNPLQFVDVNPTANTALYATKHIDDFYFEEQAYNWQNKIQFLQSWVSADIIRLQMESNWNPIQLDLYDQYGRLQTGYSALATQVRANKYLPGFYIYEATLALNGLGRGPYRYIATPGNTPAKAQKSEWFTIIQNPLGTILTEYWHSQWKDDIVFETGIKFSIRIPGSIEYVEPGNTLVTFEDQPLNQTTVSGKSFSNILWHVGDGSGVPPWVIRKLNMAITCDNLRLDNKLLAPVDGKWNVLSDDDTQLKGFSIPMREGLNRSSKIVSGTMDPTKKIAVIYNINGQLFSDVSENAGETVLQILSQQ